MTHSYVGEVVDAPAYLRWIAAQIEAGDSADAYVTFKKGPINEIGRRQGQNAKIPGIEFRADKRVGARSK